MHRLKFFTVCFFTLLIFSRELYAQDEMFQNIVLGEHPTQYDVLKKHTDFIEIKAQGKNSASGFYTKEIKLITADYPMFKWSWKVDDIQKTADISIKDKEDFAASIQIVFGKRGVLKQPKVLTYAWVATDDKLGTVIKSPRIPNNLRTIVIGNGQTAIQKWHTYKRDIREDYKAAYGGYPKRDIETIGLFTDNDQTNEPVNTYYRLYFNDNS